MPHTGLPPGTVPYLAPTDPKAGAFAATPLQWQQALKYVKRVGPKPGPVWKEAIRKFLPLGTSVNTLKNRFKANNVGVSQTGVERWLPKEVEKMLHDWVLMQQKHNFCVSLQQLAEMAAKFAGPLLIRQVKGGRAWMKGFFQRHPDLSMRLGQQQDTKRLLSMDALERYAELVVIACDGVKGGNTYTMDESGFDGWGAQRRVVAQKGSQHAYIPAIKTVNMGHLSLICCISATGKVVASTLIWKGDKVLANDTAGWPEAFHACSDSGFNDLDIQMAWAKRFEQETRPADPTEPRVLHVDNHFSHLGIDFLVFMREHNIRVLAMHPHSTHLFCVLDKGTFGSVKAHVKRMMRALTASPTKAEYAAIIKKAVQLATLITKDAITQEETSTASKCYARIGLFPVDKTKLLAIASDAELGSAEYRKQLAEKMLAVGVAVDGSALPSLKLNVEERARIIDDVAKLNLSPLLPRVPAAAVKAAACVDRKMKAGLLTGADHLIMLAAKMEEKKKEVADKAARKVARAAAKAAKTAARAAKAAAKVAKHGGGAAGAGAAAGGPVPAAAPSAGVGGAPVRKKRAGAGESAVDGARQYTKRQRRA
jgi:hypothetical protein